MAAREQGLIFSQKSFPQKKTMSVKTLQLTCQQGRANISNTELLSETLVFHEILSLLAQGKFPCSNSLRSSHKLSPLLQIHNVNLYGKSYEDFYSNETCQILFKVSQSYLNAESFFFFPKFLLIPVNNRIQFKNYSDAEQMIFQKERIIVIPFFYTFILIINYLVKLDFPSSSEELP